MTSQNFTKLKTPPHRSLIWALIMFNRHKLTGASAFAATLPSGANVLLGWH